MTSPEQFHADKLRALTENPQYGCPEWERAYFEEMKWLLEFWNKEAHER